MWNAAHVEGGEHGVAKSAVFEQCLGGAYGLIVAHVLVHSQDDAGGFAGFDSLDSLGVIGSQRFLRENAFSGTARASGLDNLQLIVRRYGEVEYLNGFVIQQLIDGIVHRADAVALGAGGGIGGRAAGDGSGIEACLAIGDEVAVAHDKPAADAADAPIFAFGEGRVDV